MSAEPPDLYPPIGPLGPLRFALRVVAMALLLVVLLLPHGLWRLTGYPSPWPGRFLAGVAWICNVRVSTEGVRLKQNVFYVANHLSWLDIPIIGSVTQAAFIAKDNIARWPLIGWLARLNHTVFVSRADRLGVAAQIEQVMAALHDHHPIAIFPEGTTTDGNSLLPFKPALFAVLSPPPRPMMVQPVLLDFHGLGPEFAWIGAESAPHNAWRVLCRRDEMPVRIAFLEPFDPTHCNDRKEVSATAREQIRKALSASLGGKPVL